MSMLNLHDSGCDAAQGDDCTCKPLPVTVRKPAPPGPPDRVADDTTKLTDIVVDLPVTIQNPCFVYGADEKVLGSAVLSFTRSGLQARLILDAHTPEAFDISTEPNRCVFRLKTKIENGTLVANLHLDSK